TRFENLGEVRNWGWEAMISAQIIQTDNFGWDLQFSGSTLSNELISLGGEPNIIHSSSQQSREGYPLYGWWAVKLLGWEDKNGDGLTTGLADAAQNEIIVSDTAEYHGYSMPRREFAVTTGIDLLGGKLRLTGMMDYKGGHLVYNNSERIRCASRNNCAGLIDPNSSHYDQARTQLVRLHPSRSVGGFFEEGDFLRLRELGLVVIPPSSWVSALRARNATISFAARNLGILWTKYSGVDPEAFGTTRHAPASFQAFAPPTYFTGRLNLGFSGGPTMIRNAMAASMRPGQQARRALVAALACGALFTTACDDVLEVTDRDIINPSDVESAAGAEAVRIGALARLNQATSGSESLFLLGGLFADEFRSGDTFIDRQQIDQRSMTVRNTFLATANRNLHRARLSAEQAVDLLQEYRPDAPAWQVAEMHMIQAYTINLAAEHYCNGVVFSTIEDGVEMYGEPITVEQAFERALAHANDGLALNLGTSADALRVQYALQLVRGRILLNLNRPAEAATAVSGVPTDFKYLMFHSQTTFSNNIWNWNNLTRRYTVADMEGGNGMPFVSANDPRVPTCRGGDSVCTTVDVTNANTEDTSGPLYAQLLWPQRESPVAILEGVTARMIEAEAALRAGDFPTALGIMNDARATV